MVAHNALHRSGRAGYPHPALASGENAEAVQRIGMMNAGYRQPASNQPAHTVPLEAGILAAPRQRAILEPAHLEPKQAERWAVHGNRVVAEVSPDHRAQPFALLRDRSVHAPLEFGFHLTQLGVQLARITKPLRSVQVRVMLTGDLNASSATRSTTSTFTEEAVEARMLIPEILRAFLEADRGFQSWSRSADNQPRRGATPASSNGSSKTQP